MNQHCIEVLAVKKRIVDSEITLVQYYPNYKTALAWYQDPDLCRQVDNIDFVYSLDTTRVNEDEYNLEISYTTNTYVYAGDGKWLWIDFGYEDPMDGNIIPPGQHTTIYYSFPDELPEASYIIEGRFWRQNDEQPRQTYFFSFIH